MQYSFPLPVEIDEQENFNEENFPQTTSSPGRISDEIERFFQNYSPKTVVAYRTDLHDFWSFTGKDFQQTKEDDILRFISHLEEKGYRNSTINRKIAALSKIMSIYVSKGLMSYHPIHNLASLGKLYKPVDVGVYKSVTKHDVEAVIANARMKTAVIVKFIATNTGLRISELIGIKKEDLEPYNTDYMRIKIKGKGGKIRFIFISYNLYQEVKDIYSGDSIYLFASENGLQLSRNNLYTQISRSFMKYSGKSGIGPHTLRHYWATQKIVEEKKDYKAVSKYLGHANPSLTMTYYVDSELSPEETVII